MADIEFDDGDAAVHARVHVDEDDRISYLPVVPGGAYLLRHSTAGLWVLVPEEPAQRPYRVVDRYQRGWLTCHPRPDTYPHLEEVPSTFEQRADLRGPLRPVLPMLRKDRDTLIHVLAQAHTRATATLLVALHRLDQECYAKDGHDERLVAGRPGSWESALLPRLANEVGGAIAATRVDDKALAAVLDVLRCWVFAEGRYTEVAESLAEVFGEVVDGRGGWGQVSDRWLRGSVFEDEVTGLLLSRSRYYGPGGPY